MHFSRLAGFVGVGVVLLFTWEYALEFLLWMFRLGLSILIYEFAGTFAFLLIASVVGGIGMLVVGGVNWLRERFRRSQRGD